jgi:hypothetical protein
VKPINVRISMEELEGGKVRRSSRFGATLALALAALTAPVRAQEPVAPAGGPASGASADIEPEAVAAFKRMSAYLRTLKAFQVRAVITERATAPDGAPRPYVTGFVDLLAQTPNRLRVVKNGGRVPGVYVCDGKLCIAWRPNGNYYATTPAPPTIWDVTANPGKYVGFGFFALEELFYWAERKTPWSGDVIKAATDLGPSSVEGIDCEHYRYRGWTATAWEICIQNGGHPLPRKLVVRSLSEDVDESTTVYTWNLAPSFDDAAFTFDPPPNAYRSDMR